ncbi:MAG TPA: zinc ribbon domain-containing protein [Edaphobacter sp.]|nr:zinc ribbon domain-containing protein [Edaphobacter sp.]
MVCQACGNSVEAGVHFCSQCGAPIAAVPPPPTAYPPAYAKPYPQMLAPGPRVQRNLQMLGILWCIFGAYRVISGLIAIFILRIAIFHNFGGGGWQWGGHLSPVWANVFVPLITVISIVTAFLAFLVGFGLLRRRSWARVVGIVVAILSLFKFPIGTALGIYTLWVLVPAESAMEYEAIADRS